MQVWRNFSLKAANGGVRRIRTLRSLLCVLDVGERPTFIRLGFVEQVVLAREIKLYAIHD